MAKYTPFLGLLLFQDSEPRTLSLFVSLFILIGWRYHSVSRNGYLSRPKEKLNQTIVQVTAIDAILNMNTLLTASVFLGISFNSDPANNTSRCPAGPEVAERLVMFEIISFSCFLFSTLAVQGLKIHLNLINCKYPDDPMLAEVDKRILNFGLIGSGVGTFLGCLFLMISIVHVIEIRLGLLSCGSKYSVPAVSILSVLVFLGFVTYWLNAIHGFLDQRQPAPSPVTSGISMQKAQNEC